MSNDNLERLFDDLDLDVSDFSGVEEEIEHHKEQIESGNGVNLSEVSPEIRNMVETVLGLPKGRTDAGRAAEQDFRELLTQPATTRNAFRYGVLSMLISENVTSFSFEDAEVIRPLSTAVKEKYGF